MESELKVSASTFKRLSMRRAIIVADMLDEMKTCSDSLARMTVTYLVENGDSPPLINGYETV